MKQTVKQYGARIANAIQRPEIRHSMHYDCGLYKSPESHAPIASVRINNDCSLPLVKLLAVAAAVALAVMAVKSVLDAMCPCNHKRDCHGHSACK